MVNLDDIDLGLRNPQLILRLINRHYHRSEVGYNPEGIDVFQRDWDNLLILDACRFDMFSEIANPKLPGDLEPCTSRGSDTVEFLRGNFTGKDIRDTVYVTGNPQFYRRREEIEVTLHRTINVWREEGWNQKWGTVLPETMNDYARRAAEEYPRKRLIVHYMQPHYPFLTPEIETGREHLLTEDSGKYNPWLRLTIGELTTDPNRLVEAYYENLRRVVPAVEKLVEELDGKTIVTSDHGNMLGERGHPLPIKQWGHPRTLYEEPLVKVPWLAIDSSDRREIVPEEPDETDPETYDEDVVTERLAQLGYVE